MCLLGHFRVLLMEICIYTVDTIRKATILCIYIGARAMEPGRHEDIGRDDSPAQRQGAKAMEATVKRWGNSLALRIPSVLAEEVHITENSVVDLLVRDGVLVAEVKPSFSLDAALNLLESNQERLDPLMDWGHPVGSEWGGPDSAA